MIGQVVYITKAMRTKMSKANTYFAARNLFISKIRWRVLVSVNPNANTRLFESVADEETES